MLSQMRDALGCSSWVPPQARPLGAPDQLRAKHTSPLKAHVTTHYPQIRNWGPENGRSLSRFRATRGPAWRWDDSPKSMHHRDPAA